MRVEATVLIPAPREVVVDVLNAAEDAPRWQRGLERMEVVEGEAGVPGARARLHYRERGRAYVMEDELLECEPGRRWLSRVSGNGMTIRVETQLRDVDGGTELALVWDGAPDARVARALFWLLRPSVRRGMRADLERLAALAASRASDAGRRDQKM
ncbi:MAG: SRPBCC family protein [Myxococcales bacterium]|nr:SRPBCC family protein [Myxococcales bacterium]